MSTEWMLKTAAEGEVFAAGHADLPLLLSTTNAEKVGGGYKFTGRKSFGSLTPVWTYLGLHGTVWISVTRMPQRSFMPSCPGTAARTPYTRYGTPLERANSEPERGT